MGGVARNILHVWLHNQGMWIPREVDIADRVFISSAHACMPKYKSDVWMSVDIVGRLRNYRKDFVDLVEGHVSARHVVLSTQSLTRVYACHVASDV